LLPQRLSVSPLSPNIEPGLASRSAHSPSLAILPRPAAAARRGVLEPIALGFLDGIQYKFGDGVRPEGRLLSNRHDG
jgi:hypothetical protein